MTNDIFTKKTPLVLAVGAALGLGVQTAWAADDKPAEPPQHHTIELGDGDGKLDNVIAKDDEVKLPDNFSDEEWKDSDVIDVKGTTGEGAIDSIKISGGTLTIGSKVGAVVFDRETVKNIEISDGSFSNSSTTYLEGASLKATGGTFTNSGTLKIGIDYLEPREGGDDLGSSDPIADQNEGVKVEIGGTTQFTNSGTIELGDGVNFTVGFDKPAVETDSGSDTRTDDEKKSGSFSNEKGTIKVGKNGVLTIENSDVTKGNEQLDDAVRPEYEDKAPEGLVTINMGNLEVAAGGKIVNNNTGYDVKEKVEEPAEGEKPVDPKVDEVALVKFGTVKLVGASFENAADARDTGTSLSLTQGSTATIRGKSDWGTITVSDKPAEDGTKAGTTQTITVQTGGELSIGTLSLEDLDAARFDQEGNTDLTTVFGQSNQGKVSVTKGIVINNLRGESKRTFSVDAGELKTAGIDVSGAALEISNNIAYETKTRKNLSWETEQPKDDGEDGGSETGLSVGTLEEQDWTGNNLL